MPGRQRSPGQHDAVCKAKSSTPARGVSRFLPFAARTRRVRATQKFARGNSRSGASGDSGGTDLLRLRRNLQFGAAERSKRAG